MDAVGNLGLLGTRQQQIPSDHAHVQHLLLARVAQRAVWRVLPSHHAPPPALPVVQRVQRAVLRQLLDDPLLQQHQHGVVLVRDGSHHADFTLARADHHAVHEGRLTRRYYVIQTDLAHGGDRRPEVEIPLFLEPRLYASSFPSIRTMISHQEHREVPRVVRLHQRDLSLGDHEAGVQHARRILVLAEQAEVIPLRITPAPRRHHPPQEAQAVVQIAHDDKLFGHTQGGYIASRGVLMTQLAVVGHVHHTDLRPAGQHL